MSSVRIASGFFVLLAAALAVYAQGEAPPGVEIIKHSWSKERIGWERDPFNATGENFFIMRNRLATERRNIQRSALEERTMRATKEDQKPPPPPRYVFSYKVMLNNDGKAIKEVDWDYIFIDAASGAELGRREFTSVESIGAGKRKELSVLASSPPTQTISVYALGKNERDGLLEKIVVARILYADGTAWKAH